jgi:transcriptional regulator
VYTPAHFAVDEQSAGEFVAQIQAGDLVTVSDSGLLATFLPLVFEPTASPRGSLLGHLARNNEQWHSFSDTRAMVIARGPDAYVSPTLYPSKAEHGRVVPTWNYTTAHVYGDLVVHDSPEWVEALVRRLTERQELARDHPWSVDDAPAQYYAGQLRAIVGVEVVVSRIEVKVKMSQNRPSADIDGVIAGLTAERRNDVADLVRRYRP